MHAIVDPGADLLAFVGAQRFATILADPPWRFINRTGKMAPEHPRLSRYETMTVDEIAALPVGRLTKEQVDHFMNTGHYIMRGQSSNKRSQAQRVWHHD